MKSKYRTDHILNLHLYDADDVYGEYNIPRLQPTNHKPAELIGFNYAITARDKRCGVHFFLDDYQFERVWREPERYGEILAKFECTLMPDFSVYEDMPKAQQIHNVFRSCLVGQIWQKMGLTVIPAATWGLPGSEEWCFDGLPESSTIAISTLGCKRDKSTLDIWHYMVDQLIERKRPGALLLYGDRIDHDFHSVPIIRIDNTNIGRLRNGKREKRYG